MAAMTARAKEFTSGTILLILGFGIFFYARTFPDLPKGYPGPGLFPSILGLSLALVGCLLLFYLSRQPGSSQIERTTDKSSNRSLVFCLVLVILFPILQPLIGTYPTLLVLGLLMGINLGLPLLIAGTTTFATVLLIYLAFNLMLGLPL